MGDNNSRCRRLTRTLIIEWTKLAKENYFCVGSVVTAGAGGGTVPALMISGSLPTDSITCCAR